MSQASHDPGGRRTFALAEGVTGEAAFSPCGKYRHVLFRERSGLLVAGQRTALFVGMNPSTAGAEVDDPTVQKEQAIAWREGCRFYVKANVMDYRATYPRTLLEPGVQPRSDTNLTWIQDLAFKARDDGGFAVAAWGLLPKELLHYADEALAVLRETRVPLFCLGYTKDGHPRHPLYLRTASPLLPYPRRFDA